MIGGSAEPSVVAEAPTGWLDAARDGVAVARPRIAESAGAELRQWVVSASPASDAFLVRGCVATSIPGWVEDMRPAIEARTTALAGNVAEKIALVPVDARADGPANFVLRAASDLDGEPIGRARTFIGFDEHHVFTCFASCARRQGKGPAACDASIASARLEASTDPPSAGLALACVTWGVHHSPRAAALGAALLVLAGVLAVVLRRKPRSSSVGTRRRSVSTRRRDPSERR